MSFEEQQFGYALAHYQNMIMQAGHPGKEQWAAETTAEKNVDLLSNSVLPYYW